MLRSLALFGLASAQDWSYQGTEGEYTGTQDAPANLSSIAGDTNPYGDSPYKFNETWYLVATEDGQKLGVEQVWSNGDPVEFDSEGNYIPHTNNTVLEEGRYNKHWTKDMDSAGNGFGNTSLIPDENLTWTNGSAVCEGNGYLCVFPHEEMANRFGGLGPKDFNWFVVNATHPLMHHNNKTRVLDCLVQIHHPPNKETKPYYFHVPTGARYFSEYNSNWCNLNAVQRSINDVNQTMMDVITVYGTTGAPPSESDEAGGLLGDEVEFTCGCETRLQTRASVSLGQADGALLSVMESTGQAREIIVELELYSDDELQNEVIEGQTFPDNKQFYFFMAKQVYKEDWSVQLQINKCMACYPGLDCLFDTATVNDVIFYEDCQTILGGPMWKPVAPTSWYFNPTSDPIWGDNSPTQVPYHALGFAKFRMAGTDSMTVACRVTACSSRPCKPCADRDWSPGVRRQLQSGGGEGSETTVQTSLRLGPGQNWVPIMGRDGQVQKNKGEVSIWLILVMLFLVAATVFTFVYKRHMDHLSKQARQVIDGGDSKTTAPVSK